MLLLNTRSHLPGIVCSALLVSASCPANAASTVTDVSGIVAVFTEINGLSDEQIKVRPPGVVSWDEFAELASVVIEAPVLDPLSQACMDAPADPACAGTTTDAAARAEQLATVAGSGERFSVSGSAQASSFSDGFLYPAASGGVSSFEVTFLLDSVYSYSLVGDVLGIGQVSLSGAESFLGGPFNASGILSPGEYVLSADIQAFADLSGDNTGAGRFNLDLSLTSVPVPAAAWLFGSGLLCLVGIARNKRLA